MHERTQMKRKNHLLALALSAILVSAAGCGGGGDGDGGGVDTSGLSDEALKQGIASGLTKSIAAATSSVSNVAQNSKALQEVSSRTGKTQARSLMVTKAVDGDFDFGDGSSGDDDFDFDDDNSDDEDFDPAVALEVINDIIEKSTIRRSGDTYTIDPDESSICSDPEMVDTEDIQLCTDLLEDILIVVKVNEVSDDQVTAATTRFQYKNATFVETDFTPTSGYYQINLAGSQTLLSDISDMAPDEDKFPVPETMKGSLRFAVEVPNENKAKVTFSIPDAVAVKSTAPGNEIDLSLEATDTVVSLSADASAKSLDLEVGLNAVSALYPDSDDAGTFPVEFSLKALTGKLSVGEEGNKMTITGLGIDTVKLRVDNTEAVSLQLDKLDAVLDASGTNAFIRIGKALNFDMSTTNVRGYLDEDGSPADTSSAKVTAPAGTELTEVDAEGNTIKVTAGGPLSIDVSEPGDTPIDLTVDQGECIDTAPAIGPMNIVPCPAGL